MPTRTSESPPPRPDRPRKPASPRDEVRGFETRRMETGGNRDTTDEISLDALYGDDINTHGSER
jgi:hypothetical protein